MKLAAVLVERGPLGGQLLNTELIEDYPGLESILGGDAALEEGDFLTRYASKVFVIHRRDQFRAQPVLQERARANPKIEFVLEAQVREIVGDQAVRKVRYVQLGEEKELQVGGVFIF